MSTLVKFPAGRRLVLGSRSPRRRELLELLVPGDQIVIAPPQISEEPGFDGIDDWEGIESQLAKIVDEKADDVRQQLSSRSLPRDLADIVCIVCADTEIVVEEPETGALKVLGQPPPETWKATVTEWFRKYYAGRTHWAISYVSAVTLRGQRVSSCVKTAVTFSEDAEHWLENYLKTEESLGKAGGYGLQAGGSLFVEKIDGSPSNVIGLPLKETALLLEELSAR
ncbi:MAG: Maf family protein [Planctomycetaceae bacterium]|nr:Maf family protein [Planctomycetaceae bacterium]